MRQRLSGALERAWRHLAAWRRARIEAQERRQIERSCREHGMLWLVRDI
jgi:hypothetical protein